VTFLLLRSLRVKSGARDCDFAKTYSACKKVKDRNKSTVIIGVDFIISKSSLPFIEGAGNILYIIDLLLRSKFW